MSSLRKLHLDGGKHFGGTFSLPMGLQDDKVELGEREKVHLCFVCHPTSTVSRSRKDMKWDVLQKEIKGAAKEKQKKASDFSFHLS